MRPVSSAVAARLTALLLLPAVLGCDTAGMTDSIILVHTVDEDVSGEPIRFAFSSGDVSSGSLTAITCGCTLDIGAFLQSNSFSKAEILGARITGARVKSVFPIGQRLNYLDEIRLTLVGGGSSVDVAGSDSFSSTQEKALTVTSGNSVAAVLRASGFSARLGIDPSATMGNTDYELEIEFTVEFEMEGI